MGGSAASLGLLLLLNARAYASTSADDAAAMAWLRTHTHQGEIVANDWFADAGIWVPYKAGMPVVLPRLATDRIQERQLVLDSIAQLDTVRVSESAACALGVAYVFHGSQATAWEPRHFPPLAVLQQSPSLEEVFHSGGAAVFKTRLTCSNQGQSQVLPTAAEGERPSW
jgi:hypothetical protein